MGGLGILIAGTAAAALMFLPARTPGQSVNPRVEYVKVFAVAGRVDWHTGTGRIAFDKAGSDLNYDVYTMSPNGSSLQCLTCDWPVTQGHNGNPAWHPSARYITFQSLDLSLPFLPPEKESIAYRMTSPGWGTNNNLWLMTSDGSQFWQLRQVSAGLGTLHAQFSRSGTRLLWSEKLQYSVAIDEQWTMKLADLVWDAGVPRLANIIDISPLGIDSFYETHGFTPDDGKIIFTAGRLSASSTDIYLYDLAAGTLQNLTNTPQEYDEHAHISPSGHEIVWATSRNVETTRNYFIPYTDYWTMNLDGSDQQRLTYFNNPAYPEFITGGAVAADVTYGPDDRWLLAKLEVNAVTPRFKMLETIAYIKRP